MSNYLKISKVHFSKWKKTYHTPHFCIINALDWRSDPYLQISFVVLGFHWWIIVKFNPKIK